MKIYIPVFAVLFVLSSCVFAQKKTTTTKTITFLKMERTACFGRCPTYMVEINKNGLVRYTGRQFTEYTGVYEHNIGSKKATDLLKQFASYKVDTCSAVYENNIPDLPGLIYSFKINGTDKDISNAQSGPRFLEYLAKQVDKVAKPNAGWKKVSDLTPAK